MQNHNHDGCKDALEQHGGLRSGGLTNGIEQEVTEGTEDGGPTVNTEVGGPRSEVSSQMDRLKPGLRAGQSALEFEEVEAWPEWVDGAVLLDELERLMTRFVVLPKYAAETLALWCLHTYAFQFREVSTYLGIESPEKRCGKTTLLSLLSELAYRAVASANISPSSVFRVIEEMQPTLLIDEGDTFLHGNDEIRGILNAGYTRKTAYVVRVAAKQVESSWLRVEGSETKGEVRGRKSEVGGDEKAEVGSLMSAVGGEGANQEDRASFAKATADRGQRVPQREVRNKGSRLARFSCWCPKVFAAIGRLPETLADRCIVMRMQRKLPGEECERLRLEGPAEAPELRRKCLRFVADHAREIASARPEVPQGLNDRAADVWEPLLVLADLAEGSWPEKARLAAEGLSANAQESSPIGALLLDILVCFITSKADRLFSRALVAGLNRFENRPWAELRNEKPITEMWLSQQLRPYGIRPQNIWVGEVQANPDGNRDASRGFFAGEFWGGVSAVCAEE